VNVIYAKIKKSELDTKGKTHFYAKAHLYAKAHFA